MRAPNPFTLSGILLIFAVTLLTGFTYAASSAWEAWFLRGIENLVGGAGAGAVLGPAAAILVFAAVTGTAAFLRAGRLSAR